MSINFNFSLVLLLVIGISMVMLSIPAANADCEVKETKFSAYLHDYFSVSDGPNATDVVVVGLPGKYWNYTKFGTLLVLDDLVTEGPQLTSATVGRFQGIYVPTSLDGVNIVVLWSIVFTNKVYSGSSITIIGNANQLAAAGEYSVASGTGKFRYAKGYVTLEPFYFEQSTLIYSIYRINATIHHH